MMGRRNPNLEIVREKKISGCTGSPTINDGGGVHCGESFRIVSAKRVGKSAYNRAACFLKKLSVPYDFIILILDAHPFQMRMRKGMASDFMPIFNIERTDFICPHAMRIGMDNIF